MRDSDRYKRLKRATDAARRDRDKAAGVLESLMDELKRDYGCETLKDAKALLKRKDREADAAIAAFRKAADEFEAEWGDALDGTSGDG